MISTVLAFFIFGIMLPIGGFAFLRGSSDNPLEKVMWPLALGLAIWTFPSLADSLWLVIGQTLLGGMGSIATISEMLLPYAFVFKVVGFISGVGLHLAYAPWEERRRALAIRRYGRP